MSTIYEHLKGWGETGTKVSFTPLSTIRMHYLSLYRNAMVRLYAMGWVTEPCLFQQNNWTNILTDIGVTPVTWDGSFIMRSSHIKYLRLIAESQNSIGPEEKKALFVLEEALAAKEEVVSIDNFFEAQKFRNSKSGIKTVFYKAFIDRGSVTSLTKGMEWTPASITAILGLKYLGQMDAISLMPEYLNGAKTFLKMSPEEKIFPYDIDEYALDPVEFIDPKVRKSDNFYEALSRETKMAFSDPFMTMMTSDIFNGVNSKVMGLNDVVGINPSSVFVYREQDVKYAPGVYVMDLASNEAFPWVNNFLYATGDYVPASDLYVDEESGFLHAGVRGVPCLINGEEFYDNEQLDIPWATYLSFAHTYIEFSNLPPAQSNKLTPLMRELDRAYRAQESGTGGTILLPATVTQKEIKQAARQLLYLREELRDDK